MFNKKHTKESYRMPFRAFIGSLLIFCKTPALEAADLGVQGELFQIEEENIFDVLEKKAAKQFSPEAIKALLQGAQERFLRFELPFPIPEAQSLRVFYHDPSITFKENVTDLEGRLIAAQGVRLNPLEQIQELTALLFLDGTNPSHVQWAKSQPSSFKWMLVKGSPLELQAQEQREVFFDQQGAYVKRFNIEHIPARISQEGLLLKIEEIPVDRSGNPLQGTIR